MNTKKKTLVAEPTKKNPVVKNSEQEVIDREQFYCMLFGKEHNDGKVMTDIKHGFIGITEAVKNLRKNNVDLMDSYFKIADLLINASRNGGDDNRDLTGTLENYLDVADEFESLLEEVRADGTRMILFIDELVGAITGASREPRKNIISFQKSKSTRS